MILLGIVEGITEWLPISSTGHMLLVDEFITLHMTGEFKEMFFVLIQLGAILAVVLLFWKKMFPFQFTNKQEIFIKKDIVNNAIITSLSLWLNTLVPSMFPMFVLSDILINYNFIDYIPKKIVSTISKIFNISKPSVLL